MFQPEGHHQAVRRPVLFPAYRNGRRPEQVPPIKADLAFLHPHREILRQSLFQSGNQRQIEGMFPVVAFEVGEQVSCVMFGCPHCHRPFAFIIALPAPKGKRWAVPAVEQLGEAGYNGHK